MTGLERDLVDKETGEPIPVRPSIMDVVNRYPDVTEDRPPR